MTTDYKFEGWMGLDPSSAEGKMVWREYEPKPWEETDVDIKVTHSGICGSDLHTLRSGWREAPYPVVVGHEIVGVAVRVGAQAEGNIQVGDVVGVGAQADACLGRDGHPCGACSSGAENYCASSVHTIPEGLAPEAAAPMLCGGVTVYSPLRHFGAGPGKRVGVVGVGGLGHFAVLFAKAMGADEVVGISRKADKRKDAMDLGCDDYIATDDDEDWATRNARRLDLIISTVSSTKMPFNEYLNLLDLDGTLVQVGAPEGPVPLSPFAIIPARRRVAGSAIGSPKEIRDMFQLAADKHIRPWIEKRPMRDANAAMLDMAAGKPRFRYVLVN
ncbi:NADP-dependent alcohol dehydrogenase 6 [Tolypocladium paradoxum]|uniref:alcohol dehydrogenase (NADP(+)) n=1 Tax=Tolypocladium paradoxum TaxID=94208 RepID=A0A2S4L5G9_9HYPO|nr:NADP-dependent alcohol dehydrogenase 6 [Tolypocladium paradoxum]